VISHGHELDPLMAKEDTFRVLVRKIDPYLTAEESQNHRPVFERSFGAARFSCDIPEKSGAAIRTIITLPFGLPYITSRVLIPKNGIEIVKLKPIVVACFDLQKKITELKNSLDAGEIKVVAPVIKGVLLTEVNEGWQSFADNFLRGPIEDENTTKLRRLLSQLLETLERAVEFHGKDPETARQRLHMAFCSGLDEMRISMRPFIGPRCKLPSIK
jgi:hypothetical protein